MSKQIKEELGALVQVITTHPHGISVEELLNLLPTPRRTLQYRLSTLIKIGVLRIEGAGRSSKYFAEIQQKTIPIKKEEEFFAIPLSEEGKILQKQVSFPIQLRKH